MAYQVNEKIYEHIREICLEGFDRGATLLELLHEVGIPGFSHGEPLYVRMQQKRNRYGI